MSYTIEKSPSQIVVSVRDDLTVAQAKGLRDDLLAAASDPLPVIVDAKEANRIDISVVQVLYALNKTVGKLTVRDCSAGIKAYLGRAGVFIDRWTVPASSPKKPANGADHG